MDAAKDLDDVAVLITTGNFSREKIKALIKSHTDEANAEKELENRLIHRQLEVHDLNGSVLFNIVRRCVEAGLEKVARRVLALERPVKRLPPLPEQFNGRKWWEPSPYAGAVRLVTEPSPSWEERLAPQAQSVPSVRRARV